MKRKSYRIKHDFLFDSEDIKLIIPKLDSSVTEKNELKLSDVLNAKDELSFNKLVGCKTTNIVIVDDIVQCKNPSSARYKGFIIRCVYQKLTNNNYNVYL